MWTRPSSRGWTEPCELADCVLTAVPHRAAAQTRRRLRADHRAEPVVLQVPLPSSPRALPCLAKGVVPLIRRAHAEFRLAVDTHTLSTPPSSEGPAFLGRELCEHRPSSCALPRSPSPCVCPWLCTCCWRCAIATAVPSPWLCTCCWRCAIATAVPSPWLCTCYPHTPTPGRGPVIPGQTCARALTHTRGHSPAYVPNQRRRAVPRRFPVLCSLA
jgi:hypothetical protein